MLFSQVKISSFRAKPHLVFHWCLYNKVICLTIIPRVCVGFGCKSSHIQHNKGEWNNCFIKNAFRGIFFFQYNVGYSTVEFQSFFLFFFFKHCKVDHVEHVPKLNLIFQSSISCKNGWFWSYFLQKNTRNLVKNDLFALNFETVERFSSQFNFDCLHFAKYCIIALG